MALSRKQFLATGALALGGCDRVSDVLKGGFQLEAEQGSFVPPQSAQVDLVSHLLNRLTFGPRGGDHARVSAMSPERFIEEQLAPEQIDDSTLAYAIRRIDCLAEPVGELFEFKDKYLLQEMTRATLLRAVWSKRQLYEVMVHFWTDHFNIDSSKGDCRWLKAADDRDVIRVHALGRFPDMLRASALSPAMLWYLDGRVNRKQQGDDKPNENYARELMELHTLGLHGGYTQRDVMEVARCLTGWNVRSVKQFKKGKVEFHRNLHDDGPKTVLGHVIPAGLGEADIDRLLAILTNHPSTANYIATKLCRRFIADEPPAPAVKTVAATFRQTNGDIRATLRTLFNTEDFRNMRRTKYKRPFEFVASALRATHAETDAGPRLTDYLLRLGHSPFQYPTPDGYPDHAAPWLGTLLWRWKFAVALSGNSIKGTRTSVTPQSYGGHEGLMSHFLGRRPEPAEVAAYHQSGNGPALLLASPDFQRR